MKGASNFPDWAWRRTSAKGLRSERFGLLVPAGLLFAAIWVSPGSPAIEQQCAVPLPGEQLGPGAIAIVASDAPATFGFDHAEGRIESAGEGAAAAVRAVLNTPDLGHAWINAGAGVVEFAFSPLAAGYGAVRSARDRLSQKEMTETESELAEAMNALTGQELLRELLLEATNTIGRSLVVVEPKAVPPDGDPVCARLEARVERLYLERADRRDGFALRMTARARLVGALDGRPIYERPYQYRSDKAMFVDWARQGGFERVARTGFRDMAERIAKDVATWSSAAPMLLGAGYSGGVAPEAGSLTPQTPEPAGQQLAFVSFGRRHAGEPGAALPARCIRNVDMPEIVRVADYQTEDLSFEIQSTGKAGFQLQLPLTRAEATLEARSDTEWALGGLENDRNFVVQAGAAVAAIPLGIAEQFTAIWHGLSRRRLAAAEHALSAVTNYTRPQEAIARQLARNLTPQNVGQVLPAMAVRPNRSQRSDALSRCSWRTMPAAERSDTFLEIHVLRASLSGKESVNPRLALNVEARARVLRAVDGMEIYSVPVFYLSREKRFCGWAAHGAQAFREELECCYRQMGRAIANELVARNLAPLGQPSVFASN